MRKLNPKGWSRGKHHLTRTSGKYAIVICEPRTTDSTSLNSASKPAKFLFSVASRTALSEMHHNRSTKPVKSANVFCQPAQKLSFWR
ncbi:MAG TPA: hypothetical protein VEF04_01485 [Blastocatellia bacterium]|nr:hypothetical protein [Blastocatellia bacterium]